MLRLSATQTTQQQPDANRAALKSGPSNDVMAAVDMKRSSTTAQHAAVEVKRWSPTAQRAGRLLRGGLPTLAGCVLVAGLGVSESWAQGGTAVAGSIDGLPSAEDTAPSRPWWQVAEAESSGQSKSGLVPPPPPEPEGTDARDAAADAAKPTTVAQAETAEAGAAQAEPPTLTEQEAADEAAALAESGSEVEQLVDRGTELLELGDVAAARLFFELAWAEGNTRAATGLGMTFDPVYLGKRDLKWSSADPVQAINWYRKAVAEDDDEAGRYLRELSIWMGLPADVADQPTLEVQPASGREGETVALEIAAELTDTDGSESLSVTISGLPEGMGLSAGSTDGSGDWRLRPDDLSELSIVPNPDFSGRFELTVIAKAREANSGDSATDKATLPVEVASVADEPSLGVRPVEGQEDTAIPLDIVAATNDTDGSETLALLLVGVPEDATLSAGKALGEQRWQLGADDLIGLTLTPAENYSGAFTLRASATASEATGDSITKEESFEVSVIGVADQPSLGVRPFSSEEGSTAALDILSMLQDKDGSESLSISVTGLPEGATLSAGESLGDGLWELAPDDLAGLTLALPPRVSGEFELAVEAKATERDGDIATRTATIAASVAAVANEPRLAVEPANGEEGVPVTLDVVAELTDTDGSETLLVSIAGVPQGASLSAGTSGDGGVWHLEPKDLEDLTLTIEPNMSGTFELAVSATASEASGDIATVKDTIPVTVTGIADSPRLEVRSADGTAGDLIPLEITAALEDTDDSESLRLVISELPDGARLSAGIDQGNGDWELEAKDLAGLALLPAPGSAGSFDLTVAATAAEADGDTATETATLTVSIAAPAVAAAPEVPTELPAADEDSFAIQVSSLRTMEGAKEEWSRLQAIHPDVLGDLDLAVQEIELDSRGMFYRVLGGPFYNQTTAEDICGQLEVEDPDQYCIVVRYPFEVPDYAADDLEVAEAAADAARLASADAAAPSVDQGSAEDANEAGTAQAKASSPGAGQAPEPGDPKTALAAVEQQSGADAKAADVGNFTITSATVGQGAADKTDGLGGSTLSDSGAGKLGTQQAAVPTTAAEAEPTTADPAGANATVVANVDLAAPVESEQATRLVSRGNELLGLGDAAAARLFFELAATAHGSATAATGVGKTLDPLYLADVGIRGPAVDPDKAMEWYKKGMSSGDTEAAQLLNRLYAWIVANKATQE